MTKVRLHALRLWRPFPVLVACLVVLAVVLYSRQQSVSRDVVESLKIYRSSVSKNQDEQHTHPDVRVFHSDADFNQSCVPYRMPWESKASMRLCTYTDQEDPGISRRVRHDQVWEPELVNMTVKALVMNDKDKTNRVSLVDIGCNIGTFTLVAAKLGYEVVAVDAMKESLELVHTSLRLNNLADKVTLVHNALLETYEKIYIGFGRGAGPASSRVGSYTNSSSVRQSEVQGVMMDDLLPLVRTQRVLIKIDIESSEGRALRGAAAFFEHLTVVGVLMEWTHVKKIRSDREFILSFMSQRKFQAYRSPLDADALWMNRSMVWPDNIYWHANS